MIEAIDDEGIGSRGFPDIALENEIMRAGGAVRLEKVDVTFCAASPEQPEMPNHAMTTLEPA